MKSLINQYKSLSILVILALAGLLLSACSALPAQANDQDAAATAAAQPLTPIRSGFTIEGNLVPVQSTDLGFSTGGRLAEVLVKEGDPVEAGQILARLDNHAQTEAALAAAQLQITQAQQAVDHLQKNAENAYSTALSAVSTAAQALQAAQANLDDYTLPEEFDNLTPAEAFTEMQAAYEQARMTYTECKEAENQSSCSAEKKELNTAEENYAEAVRWMQLETDVETARIRFNQASQDAAALKAGPDVDALAAAKAALKAAQAQLVAAQAGHDAAELISPIAGVVVTAAALAGEQVIPNAVLFTIGDFSQWVVETDNLTELDVVNIGTGQTAAIVADALPDVALTGSVASISSAFIEKRGEVTYTARLTLVDSDPRLRWGMTVAVTFEK